MINLLNTSQLAAESKRSEAKTLRAKAWADFESALFEAKP
jgi:hypothetical protein